MLATRLRVHRLLFECQSGPPGTSQLAAGWRGYETEGRQGLGLTQDGPLDHWRGPTPQQHGTCWDWTLPSGGPFLRETGEWEVGSVGASSLNKNHSAHTLKEEAGGKPTWELGKEEGPSSH